MRAIETEREEERFVVFVAKLVSDPSGRDVIGELRFVIVLGTEVPDTVPLLRLVMNLLVKTFEPLPQTRPQGLKMLSYVCAAMKHPAVGGGRTVTVVALTSTSAMLPAEVCIAAARNLLGRSDPLTTFCSKDAVAQAAFEQ